jgi:DNA repair protein RadC
MRINAEALMSQYSLYDSARAIAADRPKVRERLVKEGCSALSDFDLLCAILGSGTRNKGVRELAEEVLDLIDGQKNVPEAEVFRRIRGMGDAKATAICAALELGRRLYGARDKKISSPSDVWPIVSHWSDRKQERFICCSLNGAHELIAARVVSVGLVNRTVVYPFLNKYLLKT